VKNAGILHDVIENKWTKNGHFMALHDVIENKLVMTFFHDVDEKTEVIKNKCEECKERHCGHQAIKGASFPSAASRKYRTNSSPLSLARKGLWNFTLGIQE
jgi:hypothetical protein